MSDGVDAGVAPRADADPEPAGAAPVSEAPAHADVASHFGEALAAKRRELGLSAGDIAERLRLHPRQIAALEAADLAGLPSLTFVRGYVRNYARVMGIDAEPLLANLRERTEPARAEHGDRIRGADDAPARMVAAGTVPSAPPSRGTSSDPSRGPSSGTSSSPSRGPSLRPVVLAVVIAALVVFAIVGVLASRDQPAPSATVAPTPPVAATAEVPASAAPDRAPVQIPAPAVTEVPAKVAESPKLTKAAEPPAGAAPAPALRLSFRERSWVEVMQGDGRVLLSQVNEPGTEQRLAGQPPLRLVIGNASTVSVIWRGRTVDLKPNMNFEDVARITLE